MVIYIYKSLAHAFTMICMEIKETIEAQRGDTHFNVENPSWVKNHGGTEAKSTMRNVYMSRSYNMTF